MSASTGASLNDHPPDEPGARAGVPAPLAVAALASLGAGAIHAAAAGAHGDPRPAAVAFVALAIAQLGWGALALVRSARPVALVGVAVGGAALAGWVVAKTSGIGVVDGLEESEPAQFADTLAAVLAAVTVVGATVALLSVRTRRSAAAEGDAATALATSSGPAPARPAGGRELGALRRPRPALVGAAAVLTVALAAPAMAQTGSHDHAGGAHDDGHHGAEAAASHDHAAMEAAMPPEPYDATLPVDLGGVPGVTPEQQAWAEDLLTRTLTDLPRWADYRDAEAAGWRSIGDALTGHEHFIKWDTIDDDVQFDPNEPESLVYEVAPDGTRTLAAAMYMLPTSVPIDDAPQDGGPLVQFHVHNDLCYTDDPEQPMVRGLTNADGTCSPPLVKHDPAPMAHVWVQPHPCGPFASLEGVGAGQLAEGETRACDHAHGAPT